MSDNEQAMKLALILQAIESCEREMADYKAEHKARVEKLQAQAWALRQDILSGQKNLPLEAA